MPRPTILIGHGDFGREALQRLLATAAPRGVLPWTRRPQGGAGTGERQLRDFALLWVASGIPAHDLPDPAAASTTPEFLKDLYRQIVKVAPEGDGVTPEQALRAAVEQAKQALLSPQARQERSDAARTLHGLDLIFLAHPGDAVALGQIDNLLRAGLGPLWDDPTLARVGNQAQVFNCIVLLDFDDFWAKDDRTRRLRRALTNSARKWQGCGGDRPGPGRIYLLDSKTHGAHRDRDARLDETTLFLEFLLFEAMPMEDLFKQPSAGEPVLAAFGIRLLERSPELLGRIAAARFGQDWLPYLAGERTPIAPATRVRQALTPLRGTDQALPGAADPLAECWRTGVDRLVKATLALPNREAPDWAERARDCFRYHCRDLELDLARTGDALARDLRVHHLQQGEKVRQAIEADLHDTREPIPLASVEAEIEATLAEMDGARTAAQRPRVDDGPVGIDALHGRFLAHTREWIGRQGRALWSFWLLLGGLLGLGLTPFAQAFLLSLPEPDPLNQAVHELHAAAQWLTHPAPLALVLAVLAALLLSWPLGHGIRRRIARARDSYLDPQAGRFAALIRAQEDPLRVYLEQAHANLAATRTAESRQILGEVRERLAERRKEMAWLRSQLGEFLRLHGQHPDPTGAQGQPRRPRLSVREWVEAPGDLERMLQANPLTEERLRAYQGDLPEPFQGWDERDARDKARAQGQDPGPCRGWAARYCDAFLDPLEFVARLSRTYVRPFENALEHPDSSEQELRQEALVELLKRPDFSLAFAYAPADDAPMERRYAVVPQVWMLHSQAPATLSDQGGISDAATIEGQDHTRVYLLCVVTGVPTSCLGG